MGRDVGCVEWVERHLVMRCATSWVGALELTYLRWDAQSGLREDTSHDPPFTLLGYPSAIFASQRESRSKD